MKLKGLGKMHAVTYLYKSSNFRITKHSISVNVWVTVLNYKMGIKNVLHKCLVSWKLRYREKCLLYTHIQEFKFQNKKDSTVFALTSVYLWFEALFCGTKIKHV